MEDIIEAQETAFWPRQTTFEEGIYVKGEWTQENEAQFAEQHDLINKGSAKPRTLHDWKKALHKDSAVLSIPTQADHLIQALANEYLDIVQRQVEVDT